MEKENILGTEKIGKLIRKFSIPCIISLLVNSLYNIVDQIFIGQGVGFLGNGATNVVFPINMLCLAFAIMIGDGASAYLSLKLGAKKKEEASKGVGNGIVLSGIIAIVLCAFILIFLPQLLNLFGCTDALRDYALGYGYIIALGIPFVAIGCALNGVIRADGSPKYSMKSMLIGAILNVILDPIFIFGLHMGVEGAAIATVISQFVSLIWNLRYIKKFKSITLTRDTFRLQFSVVRKIVALGISSFITQISFVLVAGTLNNTLAKYGAYSQYGAEIPITVLGIVMKINQILNSMIVGISVGAQPIWGYNYGAEKYDRVKKTLKVVLSLGVTISTIAFLLFQTIPDKLIAIFGSGDANYMEFACMAFRTFLLLCICNGIQIPAGIFFQAIGKSSKSATLSLSRQVAFLIPAVLLLGHFFGIQGVLWAGPFADGLAFLIAILLLVREVRFLGKGRVATQTTVENETIATNALQQNVVITIAREYGSGGRYIGNLIAQTLGIKLYDKEFINQVAQETGYSKEYIEGHEQKRNILEALNNGYYAGMNNADDLFIKESELIKKIADKESCVIIGRCADFILKDRDNVIKVFVYSNMENKLKRATEIYGLQKNKAEKEIKRINKLRANHYKYYTEKEWANPANYDICINSDAFGVEKAAEFICAMVTERQKKSTVEI